MTWAGRHVLVTGAGGFIGSHLAERLVREGARVRALVHYNALGEWGWLDRSELKADMEVIAGDIRDRDSVRGAMDGTEVVFHLAALIAIPYSYQAPASYVSTNVEGTLAVLQAAHELNVARIVNTSTSEVYGTAQYVPIDERHPLQAQSPYSATKIAADKLAEAFHCSFDLPVVTVRPFNTYGPRQSARAVIPTIINQCLAGERVRLGSLYPMRDLSFVDDTVRGFLCAASAVGAVGRTFNLGTGREISIGDVVELIGRLARRSVRIEAEDARVRPARSEVGRLLSDNRQAREVLGWQPRVGLEEGLTSTIAWIERHRETYRPDIYTM